VDLRDGALVGLLEGLIVVGLVEGELDGLVVEVGWVVGGLLRERVGVGVGLAEGDLVGVDEGEVEDFTVGVEDGEVEDFTVGVEEGEDVEDFTVGVEDGEVEDFTVGVEEGEDVEDFTVGVEDGEVEDFTVGCWLEGPTVVVAEGVEVVAFVVVAVLGLLEEAVEVGLAVGLLLLGTTTAGDAEGATLKTGLSTNCLWVTGKVGSV